MSETELDPNTGFAAIAAAMTGVGRGYEARVPGGWLQGRTAYGGLTGGLAYATAVKAFPDLPPLRTFQITFIGPVTERPVFTPRLLRQGKNVTTVEVNVTCDGKPAASAIFMFGTARESQIRVNYPVNTLARPEACEPFIPEFARQFTPGFFMRFDSRLIDGHRPVTGADEGYIRIWSRHNDEASRAGTASFVTIGDVLPPAAMPTMKTPGPISSMNWQVNVLTDDLSTEDGWWDVETRQTAGGDGYSSQIMRYRNAKGELVAEGTQQIAVFV